MTKKDITNTAASDPAALLFQMVVGGSKAIENQEACGQQEAIRSAQLPTEGLDRATFEAMGIKIGEVCPNDPLFTYVELPPGWEKRATDHSMWNNLVDDKGRVRASFFYKAAFYDRNANIHAVRRFKVERDFNREDYRTVLSIRVLDCGQVVFETAEHIDDYTKVDRSKQRELAETEHALEQKLNAQCFQWLVDHSYPDYLNAAAYWE